MSDKDLLNIWIGRKERGLAVQNKQRYEWRNAIDLYNCTFFNKLYRGIDPDRVDVHFVNWYVSNLVPLVYFRDPFVFIRPRDIDGRYAPFAQTMEEVVNYSWIELGLKQQFKKAILSAFLTPPGWIKTGYTAKLGQDVADIEAIKEKSLIREIKNAITGRFKKEDSKTPEEFGILDFNIKEEAVFASWVPSHNILMPPGYHEVNKMPWLIEVEDMSMIDFRSNPQFKNKERAKADKELSDKDSGNVLSKPSYAGAAGEDDEQKIIKLYHAWDRREQKRIIFSENGIHFEGKWPYDMEGFPYKHLIFEETLPSIDESNPYPVNAITPIFPQVLEQANSRTMMVKHRKRCNAIILVQKGMYTESEINALEENDAVQIIEVPSIQSAQGFTIPSLPPDVYNVDSIIKQDLQSATSMGQMMFQAQAGQRTATQAQIGQLGLQLKATARVDVVEDFTKTVARSLAQLMWQFYDRDKVSEIIGKGVTADMWPNLPDDPRERRRIIQAELQFRVDAGSTAPPKDETVDKKQWLDLMSILMNTMPERINKAEAAKVLINKFKFAKDLDRIIISNDDEEAQSAMAENELLAQDMPQIVSPNENHLLHLQIHEQGGIVTQSMDLHKLEHGRHMGIDVKGKAGAGTKPQDGDTRPPMKSSNPEIVRQGMSNEGDIYQSAQNMGVGSKSVEMGGAGV